MAFTFRFRLLPLLAIALIAATAPSAAHAKSENKPEKGTIIDDWMIDCEGKGEHEKCFASQTQTTKENGAQILRFTAGYLGPKGEPVAVVILPLGFFIPGGAAYKVDDKTQVPLVVQRCESSGCISSVSLTEQMIKDLGEGKRALIGIVANPAQPTVVIPVSLKGFKATFSSLKK